MVKILNFNEVILRACSIVSRIPESLPCLHDRVLAAAADAAFSFSSNQKKKQVPRIISLLFLISEETNLLIQFTKSLQGTAPGILGGIVKGLKGGKPNTSETLESDFTHLESKFLKTPFMDATQNVTNKQEDVEIDIGSVHT